MPYISLADQGFTTPFDAIRQGLAFREQRKRADQDQTYRQSMLGIQQGQFGIQQAEEARKKQSWDALRNPPKLDLPVGMEASGGGLNPATGQFQATMFRTTPKLSPLLPAGSDKPIGYSYGEHVIPAPKPNIFDLPLQRPQDPSVTSDVPAGPTVSPQLPAGATPKNVIQLPNGMMMQVASVDESGNATLKPWDQESNPPVGAVKKVDLGDGGSTHFVWDGGKWVHVTSNGPEADRDQRARTLRVTYGPLAGHTIRTYNTRQAEQLQELDASTSSVAYNIDKLLKYSSMGSKFSLDDKAVAKVLQQISVGKLRLPITGPGAMNEGERKMLENLVANPTDFFRLPSTAQASLNELKEALTRAHSTLMKGVREQDLGLSGDPELQADPRSPQIQAPQQPKPGALGQAAADIAAGVIKRGAKALGLSRPSAQVPEFSSVQEAEAAGLKPGQRVRINGVDGTLQ